MSHHGHPLLSLIIPTRERAETLQYTLPTALAQTSHNFEVLVSDNFSQDNTAEVVKSFSDPRIRLINPGRRLSMSDHWDFALGHARGDYVMFLGDDDGVLPGALDKLEASILSAHGLVYCWPTPVYRWPMDGQPAHVVLLPPRTKASEVNLEHLGRLAVSMGGWMCHRIPNAYNSAVARRIPDSIREKTGRVFHSMQPDLFMAMAIPVFAKKAINVGYYVSVAGQSAKSNGGSIGRPHRQDCLVRFVQEYGDYKIHPTLFPGIPIGLNLRPDSLLVAMEKFPDFYGGMKFDYDAMWAFLLRDNSGTFKHKLSWLDILRNRRQIRRYHPFSVSRFLLYTAFHQSLELRYRTLSRIRRLRGKTSPPADNIYDFVKQLSLDFDSPLPLPPSPGDRGEGEG